MTYKYVGTIKDISYNGFFVARGEFAPRIGSEVYSGNKPLGTIVNIFGPVTRPYLSIKPLSEGKPSLDIVGKKVFIGGMKKVKGSGPSSKAGR